MRLPAGAGNFEIEYDKLRRPVKFSSPQWKKKLTYDARLLVDRTLRDDIGETHSSYTYDARNQLLTETGVAKNTFAFDLQGNIEQHNGRSRRFNACNALVKEQDKSYRYDLNGNRISDGINTYAYDPLDRLIQATTPSGIYHYAYDTLGRRISREHNGEKTYFLWHDQEEIGTISYEGEIQELQVLNPSNRPVAIELQNTLFVPLTDMFGHVRALLDSEGNYMSLAFVFIEAMNQLRRKNRKTHDALPAKITFGKLS